MTRRLDADDPCPARDGFTWPAECAPHKRTWMCWPCRTEAWGAPEGLLRAKQAVARVARAISTFEPVVMAAREQDVAEVALATAGKAEIFQVPLDDSWARDIGPTFLLGSDGRKAAVQWQFNAWGNKYHPYAEDSAFAARVADVADAPVYYAPLVCEGGSIAVDGEGTLITTEQCLLNPNRNPGLTRAGIEAELTRTLGIEQFIWLPFGHAEDAHTDGHVDGVCAFVAPGVVLVQSCEDPAHPDFARMRANRAVLDATRDARGRPLEV